MKRYLVIAELENRGYIIGDTDDLDETKANLEELFIMADRFPINELHKFNSNLSRYQSYKIYGNSEYIRKCKLCKSNGIFSVYVIETNNSFSLQQFISERQNTSYAVVSEDDIIAEVMFYAN